MAKKTVCDACENPIMDGENFGTRTPIFSKTFNREVPPDGLEPILVEVTTTVRIGGKTDPDLCLDCLRKVVAQA